MVGVLSGKRRKVKQLTKCLDLSTAARLGVSADAARRVRERDADGRE